MIELELWINGRKCDTLLVGGITVPEAVRLLKKRWAYRLLKSDWYICQVRLSRPAQNPIY